ncbi:MAG: hypothetical protein IJC88_05810 [Oscillospiraceae bacterium]|nr:hypothetical protein [Oscillospiraceae bacterium]
MKKWLGVLLCVVMLISLCACEEETEKSEQQETEVQEEIVQEPEKTEITVEEFIEMVDGIWVDLSDLGEAYDDIGGASFSFEAFEDGWCYSGAYPGGMGRSGEIVGVKQEGDLYTVTVHYPAGYENGDDYLEEKTGESRMRIKGDKLTYEGSDIPLTRMGKRLEDTIPAVSEYYHTNTVSFFDVNDFKENLNMAIVDFYRDLDINAIEKDYLVKNCEISDAPSDSVYDQMITCTYGPGQNAGLTAAIVDGEIQEIFTFLYIGEVDTNGEQLATIGTMLMIPTTLLDRTYKGFDPIFTLFADIIQNGREDGTKRTITKNGMDYRITLSDTMFGYTIEKSGWRNN